MTLLAVSFKRAHLFSLIPNKFIGQIFLNVQSHERILIECDVYQFEEIIKRLTSISLTQFFSKRFGVYQIEGESFDQLSRLMLMLYHELQRQQDYQKQMIPLFLAEIIIRISRDLDPTNGTFLPVNEADGPMNPFINSAISYINQHINEPLSLDIISKEIFVNKSYLCRIFKKESGLSLHEYLNIRKVRNAKNLLENTTQSIQSISSACGFSTVTYFERVFKKYTESTPKKYRDIQLERQKTLRSFNHNDNSNIF